MKMTMHIDEATLAAVVEITGVASKTKAVETALTEMVRRHRLKAHLHEGLGLSPNELEAAWVDPFEEKSSRVAEEPVKYGKKSPRR